MTTNPPQIVFNHILAFEVSKEQLLVHTLPADEQCAIDNKPQAVRRLIKAEIKRNRNKQLGQMLVVCEATGGYECHVLDAAVEMGLSVHRAHGTRVRHFGGYCGLLAKTDPIDARLLAQYGLKTENIRLYSPPPPETAALRALHARRTEIQQMLIAETGRLDHAQHKNVLKSLKDHIASLKAALAAIEADIAQLVEKCEVLRKKVALRPVCQWQKPRCNIARARQLLAAPQSAAPHNIEPAAESDQPRALPKPCPCCGGRMAIIETFARGCQPKYTPASIRIDSS